MTYLPGGLWTAIDDHSLLTSLALCLRYCLTLCKMVLRSGTCLEVVALEDRKVRQAVCLGRAGGI